MVSQKETASSGTLVGVDEAVQSEARKGSRATVVQELQRKLFKISRQKRIGMRVAAYLQQHRLQIAAKEPTEEQEQLLLARIDKTVPKLSDCAHWLAFGEHKQTGKVKLLRAQYCHQTYLCLFCQAKRAYRIINTYSERMAAVEGIHLHVTLTMPNTADLLGGIKLLKDSFRKLWNRRKVNGKGPFKRALGAVVSVEITLGEDRLWHPHIHSLLTLEPESLGFLDYDEFRREWSKLTGGRQIRCNRINGRDDLVEVLKYTVKPHEAGKDGLNDSSAVEVWRLLAGKRVRMLQSYGCYQGVPDVDDEEEEPFSFEDYRMFFFRWLKGEYFRTLDRDSL